MTVKELQNELEQLKRIMLETQQIMTNLCSSKKAMNVKQTAEYLNVDEGTVKRIFQKPDSPAYKIGDGKTSQWRCPPDKLEKYLIRETKKNKYKG